jgi:hypothetical protein
MCDREERLVLVSGANHSELLLSVDKADDMLTIQVE